MARLGAGSPRPPSAPLRRMASNPLTSRIAMFSGAIVADMLAKHPVPCGCFGAAWAAAHSPAAIEHGLAIGLLRDIALIALAVAAWMLARRPSQRPASEPTATGGSETEPQA